MVLDDGERELLQRISDMLRQEETELDEGSPLAARLLRYWATFYEDTWVWGGKSVHLLYPLLPYAYRSLTSRIMLKENLVAPRMAIVFRKLATAYQSEQG